MANFRKIAQNEVSLSPLMSGREQLKTSDLIGKNVTVVAFDFAKIPDENTGEEKVFPVMLFVEYPDKYYNGGTLMKKICEAWAAEYDGDLEHASKELEASGGVQLVFRETKTRTGRNLTAVDVL